MSHGSFLERARRLLLSGAVGVFLPFVAQGQSIAVFNHWAAIDRTLKDIGGIGNLSKARPDQRALLAFHYSERAQLFTDLYEYERILVRDNALHRDSLGKHGGVPVPAARYFLARAQQELGMAKEAAATYASLDPGTPERIRTMASEWAATLSGTGKGWKRDVVNWREGRTVSQATCPPNTPVCELFEAVLAEDAVAISRVSHDMMAGSQADYREIVRAGTDSYPVEFHDPLAFQILAAADFALVVRVLDGVDASPDIDAINGIALLRLGRGKAAEAVLRHSASTARGAAALGEMLFRAGNTSDADRVWRSAPPNAANMIADARSRVGADPPATAQKNVLHQYEVEKGRRFVGMKEGTAGGEYLVRALLRSERFREALDVLDALRPPSYGNDLNRVRPDVLVLSSRVRYALGRSEPENYPFARGDLGDLVKDAPVATHVLNMLQLITAPPNLGQVR